MKAADYLSKYGKDLKSDDAIFQMLMEMSSEATSIAESRNVQKGSGFTSILKEINQKWNAVISLYEKKWGEPAPIRRNGFSIYWERKLPNDLKGHLLRSNQE